MFIKLKKTYLLSIAFLLLTSSMFAQEQCMSTILGEQYLQDHPENLSLVQTLNVIAKNYTVPLLDSRTENIIPVVVHIIYNDDSATNLSFAQIQSQIEILNEDFNASNSDIENVRTEFENMIGNIGIQFRLANRDPNGAPTNGVTTKWSNEQWGTTTTYINDIKFTGPDGTSDIWDPSKYLNIWVGNLKNGVLGHGTKPAQDNEDSDGLIIGYQYFGNTGSAGDFNKGRTTTHEVGHYLNLEHIWGNEINDCSVDDNVDDTPVQYTFNSGCPTDHHSCGSQDMFENFMDYSNDACLLMFTEGQKLRMLATLDNFRDDLINSSGYITGEKTPTIANTDFKLYPNPTKNIAEVKWNSDFYFENISIYDLYGKLVYKKEITNQGVQQIETMNIPNGIYVLSLSNELGSINQKLSIFH